MNIRILPEGRSNASGFTARGDTRFGNFSTAFPGLPSTNWTELRVAGPIAVRRGKTGSSSSAKTFQSSTSFDTLHCQRREVRAGKRAETTSVPSSLYTSPRSYSGNLFRIRLALVPRPSGAQHALTVLEYSGGAKVASFTPHRAAPSAPPGAPGRPSQAPSPSP